jgi:hypothetical protein
MALTLEQLAAKYELPGQIVRLFAELRKIDPACADALIRDLSVLPADITIRPQPAKIQAIAPDPRVELKEPIDIIRDCYSQANGAVMTKDQIANLTGLPANTIHTTMYRSHKSQFESLPNPKGGRARVYRFKGAEGHDVK